MLLRADRTILIVVDIQERLANVMDRKDEVVKNTNVLLTAAKRLEVPTIITTQYEKGLGPVVEGLQESIDGLVKYEKMTFDCCGDADFSSALEDIRRDQVLLVGMEAHVCVLQTAVSLREKSYKVHVPQDAVCSRTEANWRNGLERMRPHGVEITNTESALFELLMKAGTPEFKELSKLIR